MYIKYNVDYSETDTCIPLELASPYIALCYGYFPHLEKGNLVTLTNIKLNQNWYLLQLHRNYESETWISWKHEVI